MHPDENPTMADQTTAQAFDALAESPEDLSAFDYVIEQVDRAMETVRAGEAFLVRMRGGAVYALAEEEKEDLIDAMFRTGLIQEDEDTGAITGTLERGHPAFMVEDIFGAPLVLNTRAVVSIEPLSVVHRQRCQALDHTIQTAVSPIWGALYDQATKD